MAVMDRPAGIVIVRERPRQPEVEALVRDLDRLMESLYPAESNHLLDMAALEQPDVRFFVARRGGRAVGCGAYRVLDRRHGEVKRMFVDPSQRGTGLGRAILAHIEGQARAEGLQRLSLETGIHQPEALGLYRAAGYLDANPFGSYRFDPLSAFLTKPLTFRLTLAEESPLQDEIRTLIAELNDALLALTPPEFSFQMTAEQMAQPDTTVWIARADGVAVACGALRRHGGGVAEVKRMFSRPSHRGFGIGGIVLAAIEARARSDGFTRLVLETGHRHPWAWATYERGGFTRCGPVLDYEDIPTSIFYQKALDPPPGAAPAARQRPPAPADQPRAN